MALTNAIVGSPVLSGIVFLVGVGVVIWSVEAFVDHVAAAASGLGVSTFVLCVAVGIAGVLVPFAVRTPAGVLLLLGYAAYWGLAYLGAPSW